MSSISASTESNLNAPPFEEGLAAASQMAVNGQSLDALNLLDRLESSPLGNSELEGQLWLLRAKIYAQRSDFENSLSCWDHVLKLVPGHQEARLGKALCLRMIRSPISRFYLWTNSALLAMGLLVAALLTIVVWQALRQPVVSREMLEASIQPIRDAMILVRQDAQTQNESLQTIVKSQLQAIQGSLDQASLQPKQQALATVSLSRIDAMAHQLDETERQLDETKRHVEELAIQIQDRPETQENNRPLHWRPLKRRRR